MSKERIARLLVRFPWVIELPRFVFKWTQAHYTAGVLGVVRNADDKLLIVKHVYHPRVPWGLPGGWLGRRENPATGLMRELVEETGIKVAIRAPLIINNAYLKEHLDIAFLCDAQNDVVHLSSELLDYRWLDAENIPGLLPFHRAAVEKYLTVRHFYARSEPSIT